MKRAMVRKDGWRAQQVRRSINDRNGCPKNAARRGGLIEALEMRTLLTGVLGGQLFALGGDVKVEVEAATAGFVSELHLYSPTNSFGTIALNTEVGKVVDLGTFPAGTELVFGIFVRNTGNTFKMGPGTRNPDGLQHAVVDASSPGVATVGFEDLLNGGDRDFDDNVFRFTGDIAPNVPPTVDAGGPYTVPEGGNVTLSGSASDVNGGTITSYQWDLNYDGVNFDVDATGASANFSAAGLDGPSSRTVALRATDNEGASTIDTSSVAITNVDPVLTSFASSSPECGGALEGQPLTISGAFTDAGIPDTHTATVDWGDGSAVETVAVSESGGSGTVSGSHIYASGGIYTINITLTDDDGGSDADSAPAVVSGVGVHGGQLQIIGTDSADHVTVNTDNGQYKVHADFLPSGPFKTVPAAGITGILAVLCDGDDQMTIAGNITTPAVIDGGEGNDKLNGGGGHNSIVGGPGDDALQGGADDDVLIGGIGADRLIGSAGNDVLVGGTTDFDSNYAALFASTPITAANAHDDGAIDVLTGSAGVDSIFANIDTGVKDKITDNAETLTDIN
jgi:hypothetical protein